MVQLLASVLAFALCFACGSSTESHGVGAAGAGGEAGQSAAAGDGGDASELDPNVACLHSANAFCDAVYACLSADELFALGLADTVTGCVANLGESQSCEASTAADFCGGTGRYDAHAAVECAREAQSASCEDIQRGDEFAPSCNRVCAGS